MPVWNARPWLSPKFHSHNLEGNVDVWPGRFQDKNLILIPLSLGGKAPELRTDRNIHPAVASDNEISFAK